MKLEQFLKDEATKAGVLPGCNFLGPIVAYREDTIPEAINGDEWLERGVSYIWRVGVLSVADGNKRDWAHLFIGHERTPGKLEFIGQLHWRDGENDDPGRSLLRYMALAAEADCVFDNC